MQYSELLDPLGNVGWRYLPVSDLLQLCTTSTVFAEICNDPATWQYLLQRDYDVDPTVSASLLNPYRYYIHRATYRPAIQCEINPAQVVADSAIVTPCPELRRGDIVHYTDFGNYRNDGKLIFNGENLEELDSDVDEWGAVPSTFLVGDEFLANHWLEVVDHNSIVWIDTIRYGEQLRANLTPIEANHQASSFDTELGRFTVIFTTFEGEEQYLDRSAEQFFAQIDRGERVPLLGMSIFTAYSSNEFIDPYTMFYVYKNVEDEVSVGLTR